MNCDQVPPPVPPVDAAPQEQRGRLAPGSHDFVPALVLLQRAPAEAIRASFPSGQERAPSAPARYAFPGGAAVRAPLPSLCRPPVEALCRPAVSLPQRSHPAIETKETKMNPRTYLVTAGAVLALAGPAVHVAGAAIPADERSGSTPPRSRHGSHQVRGGALQSSSTAVRVGAYNAQRLRQRRRVARRSRRRSRRRARRRPTPRGARATRPRLGSRSPDAAAGRRLHRPQQCELQGLGCEPVESRTARATAGLGRRLGRARP